MTVSDDWIEWDLTDDSAPCVDPYPSYRHRDVIEGLIRHAAQTGEPAGAWWSDGPDHGHYFWVQAISLAGAFAIVGVYGPAPFGGPEMINAPYLDDVAAAIEFGELP